MFIKGLNVFLQKKKIILIDGNSLVYRAFFALPVSLTTSSGQIINAVYGFVSMLVKLIREEKPTVVLVAFDKGKSNRVKQYADYKAHRPKTPDELRSQFPLVKDVLKALKIPIFEIEGYEADDILATLAKEAKNEGDEVVVVTGDKDALQLISPKVKIMTTKKGITSTVLYDRQAVIERYGVSPERMVDFLGLRGDPSDNIPGVPGIGEKTATKLLQEFESLENVLKNVDKVSGKKIKGALMEFGEQAMLSKQLAVLDSNSPIEVNIGDYKLGNWDEQEVRGLFAALEFNTLLERLFSKDNNFFTDRLAEILHPKVLRLDDGGDWDGFLKKVESNRLFGLWVAMSEEDNSMNRKAKKIGISLDDCVYFIPKIFFGRIKPYLESRDYKKTVYDGKSVINCLRNEKIIVKGINFDVMVAAYLLDPLKDKYSLEEISEKYLKAGFSQKGEEVFGQSVLAVLKLKDVLNEKLKEMGLLDLFETVEMPLVYVLSDMEWEGVGIDVGYLKNLSLNIEDNLNNLERDICNLAGEELNVNSSQQIGKILFEKLGLKCIKKTKTGYSTDYSVLLKLVDAHPIIEKIIRYRELHKLLSTYVSVLPRLVDSKTGRLHTSFNQTITATGRLSSSNPNLQNIPIRGELGRDVRKAFVPSRAGDELLVADYSQIELRILAHLSEDENLIRAFEEGKDIHAKTASEVFGVDVGEVAPAMRRAAKAVNFGIVYGMSPFGLSEQLNISKEEAASYIEFYFNRYPKVKRYIEESLVLAYKNGYVKTFLGRQRNLPELKSSNYRVRSFGERLTINFPIQGSAADIIKIAMVNLDNELKKRGMQTRMILQVHDELVFEVPPLERGIVAGLVRDIMENAYPLRVKMEVDIRTGNNWLEVV